MVKRYLAATLLFVAFVASSAEDPFDVGIEAYNAGNFSKALIFLQSAAQLGNVYAAVNVGSMYLNGRGVRKNYGEAFKWYRQAAIKGDINAQRQLGEMYWRGQGVGIDLVAATTWYGVALSRGDILSQSAYGELEKPLSDYEKGQVAKFVSQCKSFGYIGCHY